MNGVNNSLLPPPAIHQSDKWKETMKDMGCQLTAPDKVTYQHFALAGWTEQSIRDRANEYRGGTLRHLHFYVDEHSPRQDLPYASVVLCWLSLWLIRQ